MRKIEFNEINFKNSCDEETFYQLYLRTLKNEIQIDNNFIYPSKNYEIFYLNILGGKIILLNTKYILKKDISNQDLYYDYSIAYKIYNYLLDIYDGIEDEKNEINELYMDERLLKDDEIKKLQLNDKKLFQKKQQEYDIISNSQIYKDYLQLQKENEELKHQNKDLKEKLIDKQKNNLGFFAKLYNKLFIKRLPE